MSLHADDRPPPGTHAGRARHAVRPYEVAIRLTYLLGGLFISVAFLYPLLGAAGAASAALVALGVGAVVLYRFITPEMVPLITAAGLACAVGMLLLA